MLGKSPLVLEFRLESPRESLNYVLVKCVCRVARVFLLLLDIICLHNYCLLSFTSVYFGL